MLLTISVFLGLLAGSHGHSRWVCPRAESTNSGIKSGPCSTEDNVFEDEYIDLTPGPITLRFEETVVHTGAPNIISLHHLDDPENSCMLLDHMPHNDAGDMDIGPNCSISGFPIGRCPAQQYVTVNIPDIECDRCYLQLISVMLDKYTEDEMPCVQFDKGNNNCSTYYTCTNIKIRPTREGVGKGIESCMNYRENLNGRWPYRPKDEFTASLTGDSPVEADQLTYDSYDMSFSYEVPNPSEGSIAKVQVFVRGSSEVLHESAPSSESTVTGSWAGMSPERIVQLRAGMLDLALTSEQDAEIARGAIVLSKKLFEMYHYWDSGIDYTDDGWLQGQEFTGVDAGYPFAVQPYGSCIPDTKYYGAVTKVAGDESSLGTVSVTVTENNAWVRGAFVGLTGDVTSITFTDSTGTVPDMVVPSSAIQMNKVNVVLDLPAQTSQHKRQNALFDTVSVQTDQGEEMMGQVREAVVVGLQYGSSYYGEAVIDIMEHASLGFGIVVSGLDGAVSDVSFNGPARSSLNGDVINSVFGDFTPVGSNGGFAQGSWESVGADVLHFLWSGHVYVDVQTASTGEKERGFNGQVTRPGNTFCADMSYHCYTTDVTANGGAPIDRGLDVVSTNGLASASLDEDGALQFRITLRDMAQAEVVTGAWLDYDSTSVALPHEDFEAPPLEDRTHILMGAIANPEGALVLALGRGEVTVRLTTSKNAEDSIEGRLPAIVARP